MIPGSAPSRRRVTPARVLAVAVLVASTYAAFHLLAETTQTRGDPREPGTRSEVVFAVESRRYRQDLYTAAEALWGTCAATVERAPVGDLDDLGDGTFRVVVAPALGPHASERLVGCLNDLSIDRLRSHVVSVRDTAS